MVSSFTPDGVTKIACAQYQDVDRRLTKAEEAYLDVVKRWGESIEAKDAYTFGHCERVAQYACALAQAAGVPERELDWIYLGAFLHDVGKMSVSSEILNKTGPLTEAEWTLLKDHPVLGASIVAKIDLPWDIAPVVRHHHEHWNGGGYPDGLRGDEIPLVARIVCVADAFDALTTARSYQTAASHQNALEIMERMAGSTFDPELFHTFRRLIESGRLAVTGASEARSPAPADRGSARRETALAGMNDVLIRDRFIEVDRE